MAEEKKHEEEGIPETVTFIVGLLLVLAALWWIRGGPKAGVEGGLLLTPTPSGQSAQ